MEAKKMKKEKKVGKDLSKIEMVICVVWLLAAAISKGLGHFNLEIKEIVIIAIAMLAMFAPITFSIWLDKILEFKEKKC